ncbi:hypothetical protein ABIE77_004687 [Sinorhizobium fredii]
MYVAERPLADIGGREIKLGRDVIMNLLRNADSAGRSDFLEARGDGNAIAMDVVVFDNDVAEVNADTQFQALGAALFVVLRHHLLDCHGAADGIDNARELRQQSVARLLYDPAAMRGDCREDQGAAAGLQRAEGSRLVEPHQTAVADDIRIQDGCQPPHAAISRTWCGDGL